MQAEANEARRGSEPSPGAGGHPHVVHNGTAEPPLEETAQGEDGGELNEGGESNEGGDELEDAVSGTEEDGPY